MDVPPLVMQRNGYFLPSGLLPVRIWRACLACGRTFWPCLRTPSMSNAKAGGCFGAANGDREGQRRKACGSRMTHRRRGSERQKQRGGSRTGARARVQASLSVSPVRVQLCEPRGSERSRDKEREEQLAVDTHRSPLLYRLSRARDLAQLPLHPSKPCAHSICARGATPPHPDLISSIATPRRPRHCTARAAHGDGRTAP